jgi:transposase
MSLRHQTHRAYERTASFWGVELLDDVGFGLPDTYGGPIHTPTLSRIANEGISYNAFHTTAICSPTRAALLTGRNHQRVGSCTFAERAVDWDGYLRGILMDIANELRERGVLDEEECFIDATFVMAKGGGAEVGPTKRGKGMKIMAIVDRHGLPLSVSTHAANHHEVRLVQLCFDFYMIEAKPENLIGDRAYDSDPLDHALRQDGIEMIAPHRSNRTKPPTQDRRRLRRFLRRWLVERFFAWIQWQRRILVRWEYHPENFLGFVQLACLVVLFRRF